ncbi:calpain-like cysteine protease C2 [Phytophthora sojae]|uniref:Calpain-like cysteine protease C2 n=1 Tax=Phytophthora sojae (strain P6497) TaxID=1094619 RepID=G4YH14_PHYSP|nr:calpain-like cysteine protease C2 [Phytophthora sojae]EGZ27715.1 calpain-like cysteine protease C2 [Phytophthora sojae]|eukprot:XP_009514990.1 calpain-like cysteine protease C2 [Phytophthora sojae]
MHNAVVFGLLQLAAVTAQTPESVGYPDPRYSTTKSLTAFSCTGGARNCPDAGQYASAGGNLTLTIVEMRNLPDLDGFGLAGLVTDPYVEALIGDNVRTSSVVWNSLNPKWPPCTEPGCTGADDLMRDLNFGFRPAGTEIIVRVWDKDSGLEFGDDLVAQVTLNAIYCSAFSALTQKVPTNDSSTWQMAEQPMCVEELWVPLSESGDCSDETSSTPCMRIRMTAVPFQMRAEEVFVSGALVNGGMGGYFPDEQSWLYGRVYSSSDTRLLSYFRMADSQGGLLIRSMSTSNNDKGNTSLIDTYGYAPYARVTFNFAAQLFVFRRVDDEASSPEWLNTTFGWAETREYAQLKDVSGDFKAVAQNFTPHSINKYGDAEGRGNITGGNVRLSYTDTTYSMYFIVAVPHETLDVVPAVYSKEFSRKVFLEISGQYAITFVFVMILVLRYLQRVHWRIERVESFLAEKVKAKKPDIVAQLFFCYGDGENNAQFRRNLFYATWAVRIVIASPMLMLVSWGVTSILLVTPPAFGFGLIFLGIGALGGIYGAAMWMRTGWRMTARTLHLFALAFFGAFVFLFSSTFADPRVYIGGEDLDFFSLSCIFLTLNMMPIIWLAFTNDSKLSKSLKQVIAVVGASKKVTTLKSKFKNLGTLGLKLATAKGNAAPLEQQDGAATTVKARRKRKESAFAAILGEHYTVEQSIPGLEYADILKSAFVTPAATRRRINRRYYWSALATLLIYCIVASVWTEYGTQAVGISITLVLVDLCVYMLHRGKSAHNWSAGYVVFLLSSVRVCLAVTCGKYWILGHAFLYMVFGTALCREIIGRNLPRMNKQEAGGVTFFGHDPHKERQQQLDVGTTPEFVLGFLSFFYLFLLLGVAFGSDANQTVHVPVLGQEWPLWIFGVLAFIVVLFVGLSLATSRAFFLQKEQLLSEYAMHIYLFVRPFRLPFMLAAASEVLVICSGLFVYASTQSTFILVSSFFAPLILMLSLAVHVQWKKNDYRLVVWPPEDEEEDVLDDDDDGGFLDAEAALEKEAELMRETFVLPPLKGKGNNSVYDSADETFKMPTLPSKSLLGLVGGKAAGVMSPTKKLASANLPTTLAIKPATPPRFEVAWRALFSRKTWLRKYREVDNLSPTAKPLLNRNGAANTALDDDDDALDKPLLDDNAASIAVLARRKTMALGGDGDIDFSKMTLYQAYQQGFLLPQDHMTLGCFFTLLFLIMLYGMILTATESPSWLGQLIWTGAYVLIFTLFPTIKYFKTATFIPDMKYSFGGSAVLAWGTGFVLFFAVLKADVNQVESLSILSILVFYPIFLLFAVTLCRWQDENWAITRPIRRIGAACMAAIVLWIWEIYVFVSVAFGGILTFLLALFLFITYYLVKWVENDRYLAPVYQRQASLIVLIATVAAIIAALASGMSFFSCLSIVFVVLLLKYSMQFVAGWIVAKSSADESVFYSPYLFPVFSYNAFTNNVVDETQTVMPLYMVFLLAFLWGVAGVMFFDPLGFGVGLCSLVLLAFAGVTAHLCAVTPVQMGIASKYVNEMILKDASEAAQAVSNRRRQPFTLESPEFIEQERREKKAELEFQAIAYGGGAASAFASRKKATKAAEPEIEDDVVMEPRRTSGDIALDIEDVDRQCRVITTIHGLEVARPDGLLTWQEVREDVFKRGVGPFGFLYVFTVPPRLLRFIRWKYLPSTLKWRKKRKAKSGDEADDQQADSLERGGSSSLIVSHRQVDVTPPSPSRDLVELLLQLPELDAALDREFYEETRCVIHLQLLMLTASDARLSREKILFQKFLRENRFKLMSNGISPPANVFRTSSFASIDIPLVAVWLLSLTPEARARFHALKAAFNEEMERTDAIVDAEDRAALVAQKELRDYWAPREADQCRQRMQDFLARRLRRESEGILTEEEESKSGYDEGIVNAREALLEIESGYSCVPGEFGRSLQFVDREFPPDTTSLAGCACEVEIAPQWKVSSAINIASGLFDGGTDPDDVRVGRLDDAWLLSALSIVAASGGVDDGKVDLLIDRLFVTKQTSLTGAYALRLYQNCQWETVIVDDYFPVLYDTAEREAAGLEADEDAELSVSAGAAFAHSRDFEELWVPLVEKAFAKYYGGYAALERGYVHHALRVLSGCECEEVFLAPAARGALKKTLWQQLKLFRKNRFLLGAASLPSEHADPALRASGLVFDACYVIYDVRDVDGAQLLQLRNPPGDHQEWKGDWSDGSRLWTRRLRKRLGVRKGNDTGDDNTFWMSFDDFCHAFRALYVCRYYDPDKWTVKTMDARFSRQDATASGLPTRHNPGCSGLDNNPHFSLRVSRPTEVIITVTQVDSRGMAPVTVLPIAVYVVAHQDQKDRARRVTVLNQDNVTAHSGVPARNREVRVHCELAARTYTLLVAAYVSGMEGPFRVHVQSNYPVELQQLWPAAWKTDNGTMATTPPGTLVERMAEKVKQTVAESATGAKILAKTHELADKIAAGAAIVDSAMRDEESILQEQLAKQQQEEAEEAEREQTRLTGKKKKKKKKQTDPDAPQPSAWIEQWDEGTGKPFYFNKKTGMSSWEKPDEF